MLRALMENGNDLFGVVLILISYALLMGISLPIHEYAHAYAAYRLGDFTAKREGRLTLNPFAHLDTFGAIMMLLVGVGYAKPVPVNPYYFRNRKRDMALVALAGPASNLLMAIVGVGIVAVIYHLFPQWLLNNDTVSLFCGVMIHIFASVNLGLMVFNLLPIFPLDGSRIFAAVLPNKWMYKMQQYQQYITFAMMVLIFAGFLDTPLYWLRRLVGGVICALFGLPNLFLM